MLIWISNKFAKFHAKRLNQSENIPKRFFFWGGATFFSETSCRGLSFHCLSQTATTRIKEICQVSHYFCFFPADLAHTALVVKEVAKCRLLDQDATTTDCFRTRSVSSLILIESLIFILSSQWNIRRGFLLTAPTYSSILSFYHFIMPRACQSSLINNITNHYAETH